MEWVSDLKKDFLQLTTNQRLEAFFVMHNMSTPNTLSEVSRQLTAFATRDFVGLLPLKIVDRILCYLDGQTLVFCTRVSKRWRSVVIDCPGCWTKVVKQLCLCGEVVEKVTPPRLYLRYESKVRAVKKMTAKLEYPSIAECSHDPNLTSVKSIQSTPSGNLVMSYSVKQPQDLFRKYNISTGGSSSKILASLDVGYVVDFITTDSFLYSSSVSGQWHCKVWETGKEVFKINTKENGINSCWFSSFASPCNKCPLLMVFDTNKISTSSSAESFCCIKMITPCIHEEHGLQYGVKCGNFVLYPQPSCNALVHNAIISCDNATPPSSSLVACDYHKVVLQLQDFHIFIYKVSTQPAQRDLKPELLCHLKPTLCPDVPQYIFDCYKFCMSHDQKLIGFTCGSKFIYWNLNNDECKCLNIPGGSHNLMLLGIGDVFTLAAEVKTMTSIQPILFLTSTGEVLKVFPALEPHEGSSNGQSRLYNFLTAPLDLSWLGSDKLLSDNAVPFNDVMTVFAAVYNGGRVFSTWDLVCDNS